MVLRFVFFLHVLVFICMSLSVLLVFFFLWEENQTSSMVKRNIIKAKSQFH